MDDGELSALGIEAQHGKVDVLVLEHDLGRKLPPVRQGHGDLLFTASLDHVVVGDDEAAGITRTPEPSEFSMRWRGTPKRSPNKLAENRVVAKWRHHLLHPVLDIDIDHRGSGSLYHRGEGLLDRDLAFGDRALLRVRGG